MSSVQSLHPIYTIPVSDTAKLLLTPCPGTKGVSVDTALQQFSFQNSPALLTMMTKQELAAIDLADLGQQATQFDLQWFHLPIEDDALPDQAWEQYWQVILPRLLQLLKSGVNLTLHCKGGSGRTGMVAARIMLALGFELDDIINKIKAVRPNAFTAPGQLEYIQQIAQQS